MSLRETSQERHSRGSSKGQSEEQERSRSECEETGEASGEGAEQPHASRDELAEGTAEGSKSYVVGGRAVVNKREGLVILLTPLEGREAGEGAQGSGISGQCSRLQVRRPSSDGGEGKEGGHMGRGLSRKSASESSSEVRSQ